MSAAILCLAACVCVIMNKVSNVAQVSVMSRGNVFLLFIGREWTNMAIPWGAQAWSEKAVLCINSERAKPSDGNIGTVCTLSDQLASLLGAPFKAIANGYANQLNGY